MAHLRFKIFEGISKVCRATLREGESQNAGGQQTDSIAAINGGERIF